MKRAACLLRSAAGEPAKDIARVLGLSADAVTDIRRRWRRRRMRSVGDRPRSGRPPLATAGYLRELRRAMRAGPLRCGYVFTVWSVKRLGAHLRRRTCTRLGPTRLRRLLAREGFVVGRPGHTLRNKRDEAEYGRAGRRLARLKRGRWNRALPTSCGTPTPPSSTCCRT